VHRQLISMFTGFVFSLYIPVRCLSGILMKEKIINSKDLTKISFVIFFGDVKKS